MRVQGFSNTTVAHLRDTLNEYGSKVSVVSCVCRVIVLTCALTASELYLALIPLKDDSSLSILLVTTFKSDYNNCLDRLAYLSSSLRANSQAYRSMFSW